MSLPHSAHNSEVAHSERSESSDAYQHLLASVNGGGGGGGGGGAAAATIPLSWKLGGDGTSHSHVHVYSIRSTSKRRC